ncbi:MAG TPA: hypothetical protein VFK03_00100, partial [Candidatus Saccharimonadales bacterium]|nr:hypothetical protein [Candidatus Saccharimonadales bacterium]
MSLVDADKNQLDRGTPSPNAPDLTAGPALSFHYPALADYDANTGAIDYNHTGATIQSAIDHASAIGGGTVTIKDGTYTLTDNLTIPSNVAV